MIYLGTESDVLTPNVLYKINSIALNVNPYGRSIETVLENTKRGIVFEELLKAKLGFQEPEVKYEYDLIKDGLKYECKMGKYNKWWSTSSPMDYARRQDFDKVLLGTKIDDGYYLVFDVEKLEFFRRFMKSKYHGYYFNHVVPYIINEIS